jgi:hypothetical protein
MQSRSAAPPCRAMFETHELFHTRHPHCHRGPHSLSSVHVAHRKSIHDRELQSARIRTLMNVDRAHCKLIASAVAWDETRRRKNELGIA